MSSQDQEESLLREKELSDVSLQLTSSNNEADLEHDAPDEVEMVSIPKGKTNLKGTSTTCPNYKILIHIRVYLFVGLILRVFFDGVLSDVLPVLFCICA